MLEGGNSEIHYQTLRDGVSRFLEEGIEAARQDWESMRSQFGPSLIEHHVLTAELKSLEQRDLVSSSMLG